MTKPLPQLPSRLKRRSGRLGGLLGSSLLLVLSAAAFAQQDFNQAPAYSLPQNQNQDVYPTQQNAPTDNDNGTYANQAGQANAGYNNANPNMGNQGMQPRPPASGYGQPNAASSPGPGQGNSLQQLVQSEMQDFGVPAQATLQQNMHGPTPTSIPGGKIITTDHLLGEIQRGQQSGLLIFHVLGQGDMIPGAQFAAPASQAGSFNDQTQQEFGNYLSQVTEGRKDRPMVFYCLSPQCWMSYNAALRAINMGYKNVLWYRGGIESWQRAQQIARSMQPHGNMQGQGSMQGQGNMQGQANMQGQQNQPNGY